MSQQQKGECKSLAMASNYNMAIPLEFITLPDTVISYAVRFWSNIDQKCSHYNIPDHIWQDIQSRFQKVTTDYQLTISA